MVMICFFRILSYSLGRDLMLYVDRIVKDTVMGGSHCKVYIGRSSTKKTLISDTCWTPLYHSDVVVYYNKDKQWVDSVVTSLPRDVALKTRPQSMTVFSVKGILYMPSMNILTTVNLMVRTILRQNRERKRFWID